MVFLKDKTHVELVFIFRSKGEILLLQVPGDRKDEFLSDLRKMSRSTADVIGVIHIAEAWTRTGSTKDHITKQLHYGEMKISDLRPEDRGEALIVTTQTRNGMKRAWIDPIIREANETGKDGKHGRVSLGEGFTIDQTGGGQGNFFA